MPKLLFWRKTFRQKLAHYSFWFHGDERVTVIFGVWCPNRDRGCKGRMEMSLEVGHFDFHTRVYHPYADPIAYYCRTHSLENVEDSCDVCGVVARPAPIVLRDLHEITCKLAAKTTEEWVHSDPYDLEIKKRAPVDRDYVKLT